MGFWWSVWGLLVVWHPALLVGFEEEAAWILGSSVRKRWKSTKISSTSWDIGPNIPCFPLSPRQWIRRALELHSRQTLQFFCSAASSPDSAFLSFPLIPAFSVKKTSSLRQATNLPFVLVPLKFPLVSGSQSCNFNCKNSVNNERFWLISSFISVRHSYDWCIDHHDVCLL